MQFFTAAELYASCTHLTLVGQDDEGTVEFAGTRAQHIAAIEMEERLLAT